MNQLPMNPTATDAEVLSEVFFMPFFAGEIIADKYEVINLIGAGAAGYVISARRIDLGDTIAIKLLRPELLGREEVVARFTQEARTAVMIQSQHVVRVFDVGSLPEAGPFIAMDFLDGQDLSGVIADRGPLPVALAVEYVLQACEALATAHACGVVHRDVKPGNLFLTRSLQGTDVIRVLDFGISKVVLAEAATDHRMPYVTTMSRVGSRMYMSPEQVRASKDIDARSDIWGIGCVLYELLTGCPAFAALSLTELASKILEQDPPPMRARRADVSPELESIVLRCLHKDREKRFAHIGELALALSPFASERARAWVQRCCHVLRGARISPAPPPVAVQVEPPEAPPPSLEPAVYTLEAQNASELPPTDIGFHATRSRELGERSIWKSPRRAATVMAWIAMALAGVIWSVRPSVMTSAAGGGAMVLVSGPPPVPVDSALAASPSSALVPSPAASDATKNASSGATRVSSPRDGRSSRPNRGPSRNRSVAPPPSEANPAGQERTQNAQVVPAKTDLEPRVPIVGDESRDDLAQ